MNKSKAKRMSITEMKNALPKWFSDNFFITFHLLTTNSYVDLTKIKTFLTASLSHLMPEEDDKIKIKHITIVIADKGVKNGYQYITTDIYVNTTFNTTFNTTSETWKITKSCKVKLRVSLQKWD